MSWTWALMAACASCSPAPLPEHLPDRSTPVERQVRPEEIVALVNGEPVTWQAVAERVLELNLKESVDQYVRWKLVEDRRQALQIVHTPEELRRRAEVYLDQIKGQIGPERFRQELARERTTEEAKRAQLEGSRFLSQLFTLDKIVRYSEFGEDRIEIDRAYFAREAEARQFRLDVSSRGFDAAVLAIAPERGRDRGCLRRESFPRSAPPADPALDAGILETILRLAPGESTGVEISRSNLYYVVRLLGVRQGRNVAYPDVRQEVVESILRSPPGQQDYARWMERELAKCRVEYRDRAPRQEKAAGPP